MNYLIVQLTADEAIVARFRLKGGALTFEGAARETVDREHPLDALLEEAAADAVKQGARVVLALPSGHLYLREMELPISDRRKVREVLPLELKGETALETEGLLFDSVRLAGDKTLAVWCRRDEVASRIALMTEKGIEPEIVTASLFHWQSLLPDEAKSGEVAVSDGESLAVYRDGTPCYFRPLQPGAPFPQVASTLAALEISKGIRPSRVLIHGTAAREGAVTPGILPNSTLLSGIPDMESVFGSEAATARELAGAYAVARAAALEEPVNFRNGDLAYTAGRKRLLKKLRLSLILAGVLLALLVAETSVRYYLVRRDLDSVNGSIAAIYKEVFPSRRKAVDEVAELRSEIKRLGGSAAGGVLLALKGLAEAKGSDVTSIYEVEMDGDQIRVRGEARTIAAANDFRKRAESFFADTEVGEIKSRPDGSATFLFRGTTKGGGR